MPRREDNFNLVDAAAGKNPEYRVVTYFKNRLGRRISDPSPWLATKNQAEFWADFLRSLGYKVHVEKLHVAPTGHHAYCRLARGTLKCNKSGANESY